MEANIIPVEIDTEAIFAIGMLLSAPPMRLGLIRTTLSGVISIRVGKIRFPAVSRLAEKTRGAVTGGSISTVAARVLISYGNSRVSCAQELNPTLFRSSTATACITIVRQVMAQE